MTFNIKENGRNLIIAFILILMATAVSQDLWGKDTPDDELELAIKNIRGVVLSEMSKEEKKAKFNDISNAWKTIMAPENKGAERLKKEIEAIEKAGEEDHYFKLGASVMLWKMEDLKAVDVIANVFSSVDVHEHYHYAFTTGYNASMTRDPRVIPIIKAFLKDDKGNFFVPDQAMTLRWPTSIEFIWGAYGPKGIPILLDVFRTTKDPVELKSTLHLLVKAQCTEALPEIRKLLYSEDDYLRHLAIKSLGFMGHPDDFQRLIEGLKLKDQVEAFHYAYALYEYGDIRAVKQLIPLLKTEYDQLRHEVVVTLRRLMCSEALQALHSHGASTENKREKELCDKAIKQTLETLGLKDWKSFMAKSREEQDRLLYGIHETEWKKNFCLSPEDKVLSHDQLLKATEEWKKNHTRKIGEYEWVEERHIYNAATADDIYMLQEVMAALYVKLSDESRYETRMFDRIIRLLGKGCYRKVPGICWKAEPK